MERGSLTVLSLTIPNPNKAFECFCHIKVVVDFSLSIVLLSSLSIIEKMRKNHNYIGRLGLSNIQ